MKMGYLAAAVCALTMGAVGTRAQQPLVNVSVPFEFHVGRKTLPAGKYAVMGGIFAGQNSQVLIVQKEEGHKGAFAQVRPGEVTDLKGSPRLVFHQLRGSYFLAQVWDANGRGRQLIVTPEETQLARKNQPTELAVAAN